jgi:hypothetical protein
VPILESQPRKVFDRFEKHMRGMVNEVYELVPTAYVLIEHVLRFLFHDLEVTPRTQKWPEILRASETAFYERFTGKRYRHR